MNAFVGHSGLVPPRRPPGARAGGNAARRLPFLALGTPEFALFTPTGGVLLAERSGASSREAGVAVHARTPVAEVDPARTLIRTADGREDHADALVIAAGPWAPALLPALGTGSIVVHLGRLVLVQL